MRKRRAPETQNLLAALKSKMAVKGATSEEIVAAFMKRYPEVLERERHDLNYTALMKYVGHVGAAGPSATAKQLEMFEEYRIDETILLPLPDGSKKHRQVKGLMIGEVRAYVLSRTRPRSHEPAEVTELARLIDDLEPHKVSDRSTIGECWEAFKAARSG